MSNIRTAASKDFDSIFEIIENSFPPDEYRDYDEHKKLFDQGAFTVFVIDDEETKKVKAFITLWQFEKFAYIEHFAVSPDCRNQGLGAKLLNYVKSNLNCIACLEVEPPQSDFAKRRIGFYERNGFYLNRYPYIQPAFSKDKNPVELMIMTTGGTVTEEMYEKIRDTLYKRVYKVR